MSNESSKKMNKSSKAEVNHFIELPKLSQQQINIIALISALLSFILVLVIYKCLKYLKRRSSSSAKKQNSKKYKSVVLVNQKISKPDLKPINQQFQINTAYSNQSSFNRLFPYYNVYSNSTTGNLNEQTFFYNDLENGDQKNPSFNHENNLYLSKKFIQLKGETKERSSNDKKSLDDRAKEISDKNRSLAISPTKGLSQNISTTDSSDHRSEESDTDGLTRKNSQRLSVARPISIKFNLLYSSKDKSLFIEILSVDNFVFNAKQCFFYVKINLRDLTREQRFKSQKTKIVKGNTSVFFNETKQYLMDDFDKIHDCTLQLAVYNRLRSLTRKQLVGDLLVDLSRPDLQENFKLMFDEELTPVCLITGNF